MSSSIFTRGLNFIKWIKTAEKLDEIDSTFTSTENLAEKTFLQWLLTTEELPVMSPANETTPKHQKFAEYLFSRESLPHLPPLCTKSKNTLKNKTTKPSPPISNSRS